MALHEKGGHRQASVLYQPLKCTQSLLTHVLRACMHIVYVLNEKTKAEKRGYVIPPNTAGS